MENLENIINIIKKIIAEKGGISLEEIEPLSQLSNNLDIDGDDARMIIKNIFEHFEIKDKLNFDIFFDRESSFPFKSFSKKQRDVSIIEIAYLVFSALKE